MQLLRLSDLNKSTLNLASAFLMLEEIVRVRKRISYIWIHPYVHIVIFIPSLCGTSSMQWAWPLSTEAPSGSVKARLEQPAACRGLLAESPSPVPSTVKPCSYLYLLPLGLKIT